MTDKISRHDVLGEGGAEPAPKPDQCPCCGDLLAEGQPSCASCGYPDNSAAWVDYDGCC